MSASPPVSFGTHSNYLRAAAQIAGFDSLVQNEVQVLTTLAQNCQASEMYQALGHAQGDLAEVRRSLNNAWSSELVLGILRRVTNADPVIRLANNWGAVQFYYVLYHATQALHQALGNTKPSGHPSTQKIFTSTWGDPGTLPPWNLMIDASGYQNFPAGWQVDMTINPLSSCTQQNCWDFYAMAIRTTRRDTLSDAYSNERKEKASRKRKAWTAQEDARLAKGRKPRKKQVFSPSNLTAAERATVNNRVRPHSLIDYAYRLRIKTNYEDAEMFTEGPTDATSSGRVNRDIVRLAAASLLMAELHIGRLVGAPAFDAIADGWLQTHATLPQELKGGLWIRRHLLP